MSTRSTGARPRLTVGIACVDDHSSVYSSIQTLQMYQADVWDELEILVVDDHVADNDSQDVRDFVTSWMPLARYVAAPGLVGTAAARDLIFKEAAGEAVLCIDSHVLLEAGSLRSLLSYYDSRPDCLDLLHGPLLKDRRQPCITHMDPGWHEDKFGVWASDPRGLDAGAPPFEIPMHECSVMTCFKDAWLGFHTDFRGFGGEEGYIQEKYRQAGLRVLCLPSLRWQYRLGRPARGSDAVGRQARLRNFLLGRLELEQAYYDVLDHLARSMSRDEIDGVLSELGLPSLFEHWFVQPVARQGDTPEIACDGDCPVAVAPPARIDRECRLPASIKNDKRPEPCFDLTLSTLRTMQLGSAVVSCETISESPHIEAVHNILSEQEAARIICQVLPHMNASKVHGIGSRQPGDYRTSFSATLALDGDPLAATIYERLAAICECPIDHLEPVQIIRYEPGQFFVQHYDFIPEEMEHFRDGGQRLKSLIVYLNDLPPDETGASTFFPRLHLRVKCVLGTGMLWDNVDAHGKLETRLLHVGVAPVCSTKFLLACFRREYAVCSHGRAEAA